MGWMDLAGQVSNAFLQGMADHLATPAPIQTPTSTTFPVRGLGKPAAKTSPEDRQAALDESARYEALLAEDRQRIAAQAAQDRLLGLPSQAVADDDRMRALEAQQAKFAAIDLGQGVTGPAPYMVNFKNAEANGRRTSAEAAAIDQTVAASKDPDLKAGHRDARVGRATPDQLSGLLGLLGESVDFTALQGKKGRTNTYDRQMGQITSPEDQTPEEAHAAQVLTLAERGGLGVDCAGYVEQMLIATGQVPGVLGNRAGTMTNVTGLTSAMGDHLPGNQDGAVPVDASGQLQIQPGDMLQIEADQHIGVVLQATDLGDEIIVRVGHSTTTQDVYNGDSLVGQRPEGVREDLVAWDKQTQSWRAVRSAYSSDRINGSRQQEGLYEGFARTDRKQATSAAKFWLGSQEDPWQMPATRTGR